MYFCQRALDQPAALEESGVVDSRPIGCMCNMLWQKKKSILIRCCKLASLLISFDWLFPPVKKKIWKIFHLKTGLVLRLDEDRIFTYEAITLLVIVYMVDKSHKQIDNKSFTALPCFYTIVFVAYWTIGKSFSVVIKLTWTVTFFAQFLHMLFEGNEIILDMV